MTLSRRFFRLVPSALVIAAGFASGCTNFDRFTAGRMPYGSLADNNSPRDPFLGQSEASRVARASSGGSPQATPSQPMVAQTSWNGQPVSGEGMSAYPAAPQTAMQQSSFESQQSFSQAQAFPQDQQYAQQAAYGQQPSYSQPPSSMPQGYSPSQGYAQQPWSPQQQGATQQSAPYQAAYHERPENPFATPSGTSGIQQMSYLAPAAAPPSNPFAEIEGASVGTPAAPGSIVGVPVDQWQQAPSATTYPSDAFLPPVQR